MSFIRGDDDDEDEEEEVLEEIKSYKQGDQKSAISKVLRCARRKQSIPLRWFESMSEPFRA